MMSTLLSSALDILDLGPQSRVALFQPAFACQEQWCVPVDTSGDGHMVDIESM